MTEVTRHVPVMLDEVLQYLCVQGGGVFLDCTLGGGGHTEGILYANPANRVVAVDRDARALARAKHRLERFGERSELKQLSFAEIAPALTGSRFNGMLADLGISTDQLFEQRGFSFRDSTPLDMRMDEQAPLCAADIVNGSSERELYVALREGGVGSEAKQIARAITRSRPIARTDELAGIVAAAVQGKYRNKDVHPATVVFQALRMKVNDERGQLELLLDAAPQLVLSGGRLVVITFHSIEDKLVTHRMRRWQQGEEFSALAPGSGGKPGIGRMVEKKAITARSEETDANPSARSARLRVFEFTA